MTIGEKITSLRSFLGLSKEQLAERMGVTERSVSDWEEDREFPSADKILLLSKLFNVTTDELLIDNISLPKECLNTPEYFPENTALAENKFFGTDGFRGEANRDITAEQAFKLGKFIGWYYGNPLSGCRKSGYRPRIVIGKDARRSSYMLEYAIASGLTCSGADAYMLHVTTTPSVSYVTKSEGFDCGIMISASHNPYYDNGIKLVNRYGEKMDRRTTSFAEAYLLGNMSSLGLEEDDLPRAVRENIGSIIDHSAGRNRYIAYLISIAAHSYKDMRIGLDMSNGSSWMIAPAVFNALGASTYLTGDSPNGMNINDGCGSTHIERLQSLVREYHLDAGFAFDGDADRCIAVDENANEINGDSILYILAGRLKGKDSLKNDTVVSTVMSNGGLAKALKALGINCVAAAVGDQNVYDMMSKNGYMLGGEQSGHIIIQKYATTGDGILTAIMLMEEMKDRKATLGSLSAPVEVFPQILKNVRVADRRRAASDPIVMSKLEELNSIFGDNGRILVRESGTEPVIRVMAEGSDKEMCERACDEIVDILKTRGYMSETGGKSYD